MAVQLVVSKQLVLEALKDRLDDLLAEAFGATDAEHGMKEEVQKVLSASAEGFRKTCEQEIETFLVRQRSAIIDGVVAEVVSRLLYDNGSTPALFREEIAAAAAEHLEVVLE